MKFFLIFLITKFLYVITDDDYEILIKDYKNNKFYYFINYDSSEINQTNYSIKYNSEIRYQTSGELFLEDYIILVCTENYFLLILSKENGNVLFNIEYEYYDDYDSSRSGNGSGSGSGSESERGNYYYYGIYNNYKCSLDINNEQIMIGYNKESEDKLIYHIIFLNITKSNNNFIIKFEKNLSFF